MKYLLTILLGLGTFSVTACKSTTAEVQGPETVTIDVSGMTCAVGCPPRVQSALASVPGVEKVDVDFDAKTATIQCEGACDPKLLAAALEKSGFGGIVR